jgi:hypothetical protein
MVLAARGSSWGGVVIGLVAAGVFVVFSTYIVVLRAREGKAQRLRANRKDQADD